MDTQQRIEALERKCGRLRASQTALVGVLAAVFLVGAGQKDSDKVLRAGKLEIVRPDGSISVKILSHSHLLVAGYDDSGKVLFDLGKTDNGGGMFSAYDGKGKTMVLIGAAPNGGDVRTYNATGIEVINMSASEAGYGRVSTYGGEGAPMFELGALKSGPPALAAFNPAGNPEYLWPLRP